MLFYLFSFFFHQSSGELLSLSRKNGPRYTMGISPKLSGLYVLPQVLQGLAIFHNSKVLASTFFIMASPKRLHPMNLFFSFMASKNIGSSIRHRKLAIIHIPVGKGEGDDVVARKRDVDLNTVRGDGGGSIYRCT